jgi:hypothetical protein
MPAGYILLHLSGHGTYTLTQVPLRRPLSNQHAAMRSVIELNPEYEYLLFDDEDCRRFVCDLTDKRVQAVSRSRCRDASQLWWNARMANVLWRTLSADMGRQDQLLCRSAGEVGAAGGSLHCNKSLSPDCCALPLT